MSVVASLLVDRKPDPQSLQPNALSCAVCADLADGQHFGTLACRACAAFFRRTISKKLKYICRFDGDCEISKSYRSLCRACRLKKCQELGMKAHAVRSECVDIIRPPKAQRKTSPPAAPFAQYDNPLPVPTPTTLSLQQLHIVSPPATTAPVTVTPVGSNGPTAWTQRNCDSVSSGVGAPNSVESDSPYSSSSWPHSPSSTTLSAAEALRSRRNSILHDIVEVNTEEYFVDIHSLPPSHPMLMRMLIAYEGLQRRRDLRFDRARDCDGVTSRVYTRRDTFDVHRFFQITQVEIEVIAEMLQTFEGYRELPHADKVEIFKSYWIHFVILERNFDTFRILGAAPDDRRIVFANGDIIDVLHCSYDLTQVTDAPIDEVRRMCHPWYRMSAQELIVPVKKLAPTDVEMMFCLGLMLWHFSADLTTKLSPATVQLGERMVDSLYNELSAYYNHVVSVDNSVRRVAELMRLIALTERIIVHRKEDIILARTFKTFKVDIYMTEIFEG